MALPLALPIRKTPAPATLIAGLAFLLLFAQPVVTLASDWWNDPDAGHGLLLFPIALWLAWKRGRAPNAGAQPVLGLVLLVAAVLLRYLSGLAAELYTMRLSLLGAAAALIIFSMGVRQLLHWWLPVMLIFLSVPLPDVLTSTLALPLQLRASTWGAELLEMRNVPVRLNGNVIRLPGQQLFVTEACSGLRSLTALLSLGLLIAGLWLKTTPLRVLLVVMAIPIAMVLNALRIFITGFLVFYVDPSLAEGVMHYSEGWAMFVIAFLMLSALALLLSLIESWWRKRGTPTRIPPAPAAEAAA